VCNIRAIGWASKLESQVENGEHWRSEGKPSDQCCIAMQRFRYGPTLNIKS
jgi:hypothetical protein